MLSLLSLSPFSVRSFCPSFLPSVLPSFPSCLDPVSLPSHCILPCFPLLSPPIDTGSIAGTAASHQHHSPMSRLHQALTTPALFPHGVSQRRSWVKTAVAFVPFLALVLGSWLYAFHLDRLANQSMVRSKDSPSVPPSNGRDSQTNTDRLGAESARGDDIIIGDSKENVFYFIQVTRAGHRILGHRQKTPGKERCGQSSQTCVCLFLSPLDTTIKRDITNAHTCVWTCSLSLFLPSLSPIFDASVSSSSPFLVCRPHVLTTQRIFFPTLF